MKILKVLAVLITFLLLIYKALRYMLTDISFFGYEMGRVKR